MIRSMLKAFASVTVGVFLAWLVINLSEGAAVIPISQEEAEGPEFSDPSSLDIVTKFVRRRVCQTTTQRYVWRWTTYKGERVQQAVPLQSTLMPFLADGNMLILTLPNPGVPDLNDKWLYRAVSAEYCGWLPSWLSGMSGSRFSRSQDMPVNFVGEPHPPK